MPSSLSFTFSKKENIHMTQPAAQLPPGIYSALHQPVPAVPKNLTLDDAKDIKNTLVALYDVVQQRSTQAGGGVQSAQGSNFTKPATQLSPLGTWLVTYAGACFKTYTDWDSENLENNKGNLLIVGGMSITAAHAIFVYWKNNRQKELIATRQTEFVHLQTIFNALGFLRESTRMAKACLKTDPPANLPLIYPVFETYMNGLPAGVVPNALSSEWNTVSQIIRSQNLDALSGVVQGRILPFIKHYSDNLMQELTALGYAPPPEIVVEGSGGGGDPAAVPLLVPSSSSPPSSSGGGAPPSTPLFVASSNHENLDEDSA